MEVNLCRLSEQYVVLFDFDTKLRFVLLASLRSAIFRKIQVKN